MTPPADAQLAASAACNKRCDALLAVIVARDDALAAAQATIVRLTTALGAIEYRCAYRASQQETIDAGAMWNIANTALAPPAPEADDAR